MLNEELKLIKDALEDKKADNVRILDVASLTTICDYMVIADSSNVPHLNTIVDAVEEALGKAGITFKAKEGNADSGWVLLDYRDIIVQLFLHDMREFYDLERIWSDAVKID